MIDEGVRGFPCFYTFKVFGRRDDAFCERVRAVVAARAGAVALDSVRVRTSEHGKYLCISILTHLHSRDQMELIYGDLRAEQDVLLCL
ncbi:MAG: DUF493 domain-containing protein [Deltaproteobacteria bacterium]|nr:DUF493 domain-containing protein [Deltaproteobacteria bacterium]